MRKDYIKIISDGDNIIRFTDYDIIEDSGEITHLIAELEVTKLELLELWQNKTYNNEQ